MTSRRDARLWAGMALHLHDRAGLDTAAAELHARHLLALMRRARTAPGLRTWAPGEDIPADVAAGYDLDGDAWRQRAPGLWELVGFDPTEHEPRSGEVLTTADLLAEYGPVTEIRTESTKEGNPC